jgi:hypothetical protein
VSIYKKIFWPRPVFARFVNPRFSLAARRFAMTTAYGWRDDDFVVGVKIAAALAGTKNQPFVDGHW